jgi:hypothetical protein
MKRCILQITLLSVMGGAAWGGITVTAENPGVQTTTVPSVTTYTFDSLSTGLHTNVTANFGSITGTYNQLYILAANGAGGANSTNYPECAFASPINLPTYTLTLSSPVNYIGFWWSAGDPSNRLDFYLGGIRIGSFSTAVAMGALPATYDGNPNNGQFPGQPFAYLNFFGTGGTTFDKVVFSVVNDPVAGFETDNHSIAVNAVPNGGLLIATVNTTTPVGVPVLSVWAAIALAVLLSATGALLLLKRPRQPDVS